MTVSTVSGIGSLTFFSDVLMICWLDFLRGLRDLGLVWCGDNDDDDHDCNEMMTIMSDEMTWE